MNSSESTVQTIDGFDQSGSSPPPHAERRPKQPPVRPLQEGAQRRGPVGERLLRPSDVQARLGLGRTKVYEMMAAGVLPSVELGRRCHRVPENALDDWIRLNTKHAHDSCIGTPHQADGRAASSGADLTRRRC
jgi:excisionase family DNA binding protein